MARSRNIKPGFFTNEVLGELDPLARLLFAGLWCHADREGRLEDRLRRLKPQILPFDNCDIEVLAQSLHDAGIVLRYVVDGKRYIQILKFKEHQNPHVKEAPSTIPAPDKNSSSMEVATLIPSSLIPDSLNPHTDSLQPLAQSQNAAHPQTPKNGNAVAYIPITGDKEFIVTQEFVDTLEAAYPAVDVPLTLREIRAWCISNPARRKTARGVKRFLNAWCSKEQNNGP